MPGMLKSVFRRFRRIRLFYHSRPFSNRSLSDVLEIGYVPEHYCGPLHLAIPSLKALLPSTSVKLVPFPRGTGHMITEFQKPEPTLDLAIGLTEAWLAGILNTPTNQALSYQVVGQWVTSPLRWAIVTGRSRKDITSVADLQKKKTVGVSRHGSGSHIMASVLAQERGWPGLESAAASFKVKPLGAFPDLIRGVNDGEADFFMWEHFTTKPSWTGPDARLKRIGEIYAPWPGWMIAASTAAFPSKHYGDLGKVFKGLENAIAQFTQDKEKSIEMLGTGELACIYEEDDAREWIEGVTYSDSIEGIDGAVIRKVVETLRLAGAVKEAGRALEDICGISRPAP